MSKKRAKPPWGKNYSLQIMPACPLPETDPEPWERCELCGKYIESTKLEAWWEGILRVFHIECACQILARHGEDDHVD